MHDFRRLDVWHKSVEFGGLAYRSTGSFPRAEMYEMRKQIRSAAVSVLSNIAEGSGPSTPKDVSHFLDIARASALEVEAQALFAEHLGWMKSNDQREISRLADEIRAMLVGMTRSLES